MRKILMLFTALLLLSVQLLAQSRTISGKVTDSKGAPVPNASVLEKGTNAGTVTKEDGSYSVTVTAKARILVFSSIGMASQEISIGSRTTIDVSLVPGDNNLSEVVVVGYQTLKRTEVIGTVATVAGKELAQKPIGSFTQLLQGKAAGVQVTGQSGRPGANGYIRVRGTGSINASNEPLILLDGVPISSTAYALLNPNDIEDLNVLKDAASQAIYGSRAANGVILITSKKGRGKPEVRYSFQYGRTKPMELKNLTLMNSQQKLQYELEGNQSNPILDSMIANRVLSGALPAGSTLFNITTAQRQDLWNLAISRGAGDWTKYLLQDGTLTSHEVSVSGAGDKVKYYFSLNKSDNEGVSYGSFWNKKGGRLNIEYTPLDWFKIGTQTGVTYSQENNVRSLFNTQSAYTALFSFNPYEPVFQADGKTYNNTHTGYSPIEGTINNPSLLNRISTFSTIYGEAKFLQHLTLRSQLGINYNTLQQENYLKPGSNLAGILGYNEKSDAGNWDFTYVLTNTANWQQTINDVHSINILAGQEFTKNKFYSWSLAGRGMPGPDQTTVDNAGSASRATTSRQDWSLSSFFASASYDYDKKYYLALTGRRDGSSRFGANVRYSNFWSVGAAWDISQEEFMKSVNFISSLKLKGSIGTSGTVPAGLYDNLGTYGFTTKYRDLPSAAPVRLENADLTWETNQNFDIGIDFGLLNNRITGAFDYYNRKTNDLIYPRNVSLATGFASYNSNVGNLRNTGIELTLNADVIRRKDLVVSLFGNFSNNDNKALKLYSNNVTQNLSRLVEGEPLFTYFLVRWAGINPANGKNLFYKADGSLTETYASSDAVLLKGKSPQVKWYGSFGTNVSYKGFDLTAQFYYSGGNYIMNYMYQVGASEGENLADNQFTEAFGYWKKPGDKAAFANLNDLSQRVTFDTDKYLEKGDYVTLRDVTLGYTLPADIAKRIKLKSIRLYTQGTNLWVGTKFRGLPEVGEPNGESTVTTPGLYTLYSQPQFRAITFGIDVRF